MQSLATFFEDNKLLAIAAAVAAFLVLIIVVFVLYRLLFGRRLRAATNGRARQPRLGIVDAYDLDRQRQLVLVRRDNVEHLIMIGGPTDVVIESSIVRTQSAAPAREKDSAGPLIGTVTPPALSAAGAPPALPPAAAPAPVATTVTRSEPAMAARVEPAVTGRAEPPLATPAPSRTEPPLGTPMPSPLVERTPADRGGSRPIAMPDPAAPPPAQQPAPPPPVRTAPPPRPASLPPRPALPDAPAAPPAAGAAPNGVPATAAPAAGGAAPERPAQPRMPLPPRPPVQRPPLPPRPSLASSLPPRPVRPLPARTEAARPEGNGNTAVPAAAPVTEQRVARGPEPAPSRGEPVPAPPKNIETLESLEEEMAKLLGRPPPRREG